MKVTTDTADLLIIDDRPIILGLVLTVFVLIFIGVGLDQTLVGDNMGLLYILGGGGAGFLALWSFVRRVQVVFHRPENWVEMRRRNLFGNSVDRFQLDEIARAVVEDNNSAESGTTWRVALVVETGPRVGQYPLTRAYSNGSGHHRAADKINDWLGAN